MTAVDASDVAASRRQQFRRAALGAGAVAVVDLGAKAGAGRILGLPAAEPNPQLSLGLVGGSRSTLVVLMSVGIVAMCVGARWALVGAHVPWWSVSLVLGGSVANLLDRLFTGAVHDFIPVGPLVVNVADLAFVAGLAAAAVRWPRRHPCRLGQQTQHQRRGEVNSHG